MNTGSKSTSRNILRDANYETGQSETKNSDKRIKTKRKMVCPYCQKYSLITFEDYKINISCCGTFTFEEYYNKLKGTNHQSSEQNDIIIYRERDINSEIKSELESEISEYLCKDHKKEYIFYCKECKKDLCESCKCKHKKHNLIIFEDMQKDIDQEKLKEKVKEFKIDLNEIKENINSILDKIIENIEYYWKINKEINDSYKNNKYIILKNIETINAYNTKIIKDMNDILNKDEIKSKFYELYNIYKKMISNNNELIIESYMSEKKSRNSNEININKFSSKNSNDSINTEDKKISIKLKINNKKKFKKLKIFGDKFVEKNQNCEMKINENSFINKNDNNNIEYEQIKTHIDSQNIDPENIIIDLKGFDNNIDLSYMFNDCRNIKYLEFLEFKVTNIINISNMFSNCCSLEEIKQIFTNTSEVTNMSWLFANCIKLSNLSDIKIWDTSKVTDMSGIFYNCCSLTTIDISSWDTSNVIKMNQLFDNCEKLKDISSIKDWKTSKVKNMGYIFNNCKSLIDVTSLSKWDFRQVEKMNNMFANCTKLEKLCNFKNASNVKDISFMFYRCSSLTSLNATFEFNDKVKDMSFMFYKCENLKIEDIEEILETKLYNADKTGMLEGCKSMKKYKCFIL